MTHNAILVDPQLKFYSDKAIWVGTFVGGPIVAGYLLAENFKKLEQENKATKAWVYSIGATMILVGLALLTPGFENVPGPLMPFVYSATASFLYKVFQARQVALHIKNGGQLYSTGRAALAGTIGLFVMIVIFISLISGLDISI